MELKDVLEAILFSAQKPLTVKELAAICADAAEHGGRDFAKTKPREISAALEELAAEHEAAARTWRLSCVAEAWQFTSQQDYAPWIKALVGQKQRAPRLSKPALETLAIIAYRQPVTRAQVEEIRGVAVDGVLFGDPFSNHYLHRVAAQVPSRFPLDIINMTTSRTIICWNLCNISNKKNK